MWNKTSYVPSVFYIIFLSNGEWINIMSLYEFVVKKIQMINSELETNSVDCGFEFIAAAGFAWTNHPPSEISFIKYKNLSYILHGLLVYVDYIICPVYIFEL